MKKKDIFQIDDFSKNSKFRLNDQEFAVAELLAKDSTNHERLILLIHKLITELNGGVNFGQELSEEWTRYFLLFLSGYGENLKNPYGDISDYQIQSITRNSQNLADINSIRILDSLPDKPLAPTASENLDTLWKTLLIIAIGGTDTTFYKGLSPEEMETFARELYGEELFCTFSEYDTIDFIPRGFAAKYTEENVAISNVESIILHAYHAGIRNVAIIGNSKSYQPISKYLQRRLKDLSDLNIVVVPQPLLPVIQVAEHDGEIIVSLGNGGYPGGHGHGFKYCLSHPMVKNAIHAGGLEYFIFGNGDNAAILNWGANHFAWTISQLKPSVDNKTSDRFRIAFFLVWEYLRKGGFTFLLTNKMTGEQFTQIIESELAEKSGADIESLGEYRGGYNTNVATGIIQKIERHFKNLSMALKQKNHNYVFEASLGTAISTSQDSFGSSRLDPHSVMSILGPKEAIYQHWNHISIRKRGDFFAYQSSLFSIGEVKTDFGDFPLILTRRDGTRPHPLLKGDVADPDTMSTKDFYNTFKDSYFDVDRFTGTLHINFGKASGKVRGRVKFEGGIRLIGSGELRLEIEAGELWIVRDIELVVNNLVELSRNDCKVIKL